MNTTKTFNPGAGDFLRHEGRVYKAIGTDEFSCAGCCFFDENTSGVGCNSPIDVNCDYKILKDVTDVMEDMDVELIDAQEPKYNILPFILLGCVVFWIVIIYLIVK